MKTYFTPSLFTYFEEVVSLPVLTLLMVSIICLLVFLARRFPEKRKRVYRGGSSIASLLIVLKAVCFLYCLYLPGKVSAFNTVLISISPRLDFFPLLINGVFVVILSLLLFSVYQRLNKE